MSYPLLVKRLIRFQALFYLFPNSLWDDCELYLVIWPNLAIWLFGLRPGGAGPSKKRLVVNAA